MLKISRHLFFYIAFLGFIIPTCDIAFSAETTRAHVLISVNGKAITQEEILAANPEASINTQLRLQTAEQLAQQQLLADTIEKIPTELASRIEAAQENLKRQTLAQLAVDQFFRSHPINESQVETEYERILAALPPQQFWLRWIVVKTPDEAKEIIDLLRKGEKNFASLAIERSIGQNAELGGALGWQSEQTLQAAVLGIVRKLKAGEVAGPIAFDGGYAIVQLLAKRETPKPTLTQLRPQIIAQLQNSALQQYIRQLAESAKIKNFLEDKNAKSNNWGGHEQK